MLEINPQSKFIMSSEYVLHQIEELEKYWLFNITTGDIFKLNAVSMCIMQNLHKTTSYLALVEILLQQFEVDEDTARRDVKEVLVNLMSEGIITEEKGEVLI